MLEWIQGFKSPVKTQTAKKKNPHVPCFVFLFVCFHATPAASMHCGEATICWSDLYRAGRSMTGLHMSLFGTTKAARGWHEWCQPKLSRVPLPEMAQWYNCLNELTPIYTNYFPKERGSVVNFIHCQVRHCRGLQLRSSADFQIVMCTQHFVLKE